MRVKVISLRRFAPALLALGLAACDRAADPPAARQDATGSTTSAMAPDSQDTVGGQGIVADTTFSSGAPSTSDQANANGNLEGALMTDEPTSAGLPNADPPHAAQPLLQEVDRQFLSAAIDSSTYDLTLARLGFNKAKEPEVKLFAQRVMVQQQHTHDRLLQMAASQEADLAGALPPHRQAVVNRLAQTSGHEFDTRLLDALGIKAQTANIALYEKAVQEADHPSVRELAETTLHASRRQLHTAEALQRAQASAQTANPMP